MADTWYPITDIQTLQARGQIAVDVNNIAVLLVVADGEVFAIENRCSHEDAELEDGEIAELQIECPHHGARFCLRTGEALSPPAVEDIDTFPVRITNGTIEVMLP